jgi:cobalt-zinc-cadmium efflux system outer membrane protein
MASRPRARRYRDEVIPLRRKIAERVQEQQNWMFVGAFDAIRSRRQVHDGQRAYAEALRDYWLARVELERAVGAQLPSSLKNSHGGQS